MFKHIRNAVDSNMPSSLFNFRIDDPAIDFHKSFYINAGMQNKKYNKIDFLFRDIADNVTKTAVGHSVDLITVVCHILKDNTCICSRNHT